jgi:hypothetical protein
MRWLAIVSALLITGCSSAPMHSPSATAVAVHPPPTLDRPWLVPTPRDEITLFDTRMLQALRERDDIPASNANGTGRVKMPGLWIGIGLGVTAGIVAADAAEDVVEDTTNSMLECFFDALFGGDDC